MKLKSVLWIFVMFALAACDGAGIVDDAPDIPDPDKSVYFCTVDEDCVFSEHEKIFQTPEECKYCSCGSIYPVNKEERELRQEAFDAVCVPSRSEDAACIMIACEPNGLNRCIDNKCTYQQIKFDDF